MKVAWTGKSTVCIQLNKQSAIMTFLIKQCRGNNNIFCHWLLIALYIVNDFIALHVRHGDKSTETAVFHLDKYMDSIKRMSNLHKTNAVFISTEDQGVIDSLDQYPEYEFKFTKGHKRQNIAIEDAFKLKLTTPEKEAFIAFKNLFISMTGTSFVGTFSSNWSRLVYEMMFAAHGSAGTSFISLDIDYVT